MRLMEKMRQKKLGNKGFTLVELIIVIAIMAVLLGIVGTQVVPYLNRAREAKDLQIINSYCTAAVSAYSMHAETFGSITPDTGSTTVTVKASEIGGTLTDTPADSAKHARYLFLSTMQELVGNYTIGESGGTLRDAMVSKAGSTITEVNIIIDVDNGTVTATAVGNKTKYPNSSLFNTEVKAVIGSPAPTPAAGP